MHKTSHHNCRGKDGIGLTAGCKVLRVERIENMLLWKQYCTGPAALSPNMIGWVWPAGLRACESLSSSALR